MKMFFFIAAITFAGLVKAQDESDAIMEIDVIRDSLNSSKILKIKPDTSYLKNLSHIYLPTNEAFEMHPYLKAQFSMALEKRYNCVLEFLQEDSINGGRDFYFQVSRIDGEQVLVVVLHLSVIEQLYQENILKEYLEAYYKWYKLYINYYEN